MSNLSQLEIEDILAKNQDRYIEHGKSIQEIYNYISKLQEEGYLRHESLIIAGLINVAVAYRR